MTTKDGEPAVGSGILTPATEGQGVTTGTVIHIGKPHGVSPMGLVYEVETLAELPPPKPRETRDHAGPAMVNSAAFREGWERVFGGRQQDDLPN